MELTVLDAMLGAGATLLGGSLEVALSTADPLEDGSGLAEPSGNGYARVSVNNDGAQWGAASTGGDGKGLKDNLATITFPAASGGAWGLISHWAIIDGGNVKIKGLVDNGSGVATPRQVNDGDIFRFPVGNLRIKLD
jgi:hypothetical protein